MLRVAREAELSHLQAVVPGDDREREAGLAGGLHRCLLPPPLAASAGAGAQRSHRLAGHHALATAGRRAPRPRLLLSHPLHLCQVSSFHRSVLSSSPTYKTLLDLSARV